MALDDKLKGLKDQAVGKVKEEYGDATDDKSKELEGKLQKNKGKMTEKVEEGKDRAHDKVDDWQDKNR
ncbi:MULTISPECIES: CsbD family protein [unclassified Jeotgalibaca]|uniref:CsbD family protein n=1 Tax=unclassified Jeotgalibaca TaxID=2621505 RepID=UPI003FCF4CB3